MAKTIFYKYVSIKNISRGKIAAGIEDAIKATNIKRKINLKDLIDIVHEKEKYEQQLRLNILFENSLHFSYPKDFNDPFDSHVFCRYEGTKDEWENYFIRYPNDNLRADIRRLNYDQVKIDKLLKYVTSNFPNSHIACCFTKRRNNMLMWTHYASNHRGICLGLESANIDGQHYIDMDEPVQVGKNASLALLNEVKYVKLQPERINPVRKAYFEFDMFHTTKTNKWNYEKEYRILIENELFNNATNHYSKLNFKFKKEILREIIFGINTDSDLIIEIRKFVKENYIDKGLNVKLLKALKREYSYGMDFVPIEKLDPVLIRWNCYR